MAVTGKVKWSRRNKLFNVLYCCPVCKEKKKSFAKIGLLFFLHYTRKSFL